MQFVQEYQFVQESKILHDYIKLLIVFIFIVVVIYCESKDCTMYFDPRFLGFYLQLHTSVLHAYNSTSIVLDFFQGDY